MTRHSGESRGERDLAGRKRDRQDSRKENSRRENSRKEDSRKGHQRNGQNEDAELEDAEPRHECLFGIR